MRKDLPSMEFTAEDPVEFRALLDKIRGAADLSCGQIAVKTGIPRSQAYNLVSSNRTTMPSLPDQVKKFVVACGLPPMQVAIVMKLWEELRDQAASESSSRRDDAADADRDTDDEPGGARDGPGVLIRDVVSVHRRGRAVRDHVVADFLFLILDSSVRTRRALLLMLPVVGTYMFTLALVVMLILANQLDSATVFPLLAAMILGPLGMMRRLGRPQMRQRSRGKSSKSGG